MPLIKFERTATPIGSVDFTVNPDYGLAKPKRPRQPMDMTDGGTPYYYDKGVTEQFIKLPFKDMPKVDYDAMNDFFENVTNWKEHSFTYWDENGASYTALLESDELGWPLTGFESYTGTLKLRILS